MSIRKVPAWLLGVIRGGEPLIRLIEVAAIVIGAVVISNKQVEIAKNQADIARVAISPDFDFGFDFGHEGGFSKGFLDPSSPHHNIPIVKVINKGKSVRNLTGALTTYLEIPSSPNKVSRIELANLVWETPEEAKHNFAIESPDYLQFLLNDQFDDLIYDQFRCREPLDPSERDLSRECWPVDLKFFVELHYFDSLGAAREEKFVFLFPNRRVEPVIEKPRMDYTVDVLGGERSWATIDIDRIYGQIDALILLSASRGRDFSGVFGEARRRPVFADTA